MLYQTDHKELLRLCRTKIVEYREVGVQDELYRGPRRGSPRVHWNVLGLTPTFVDIEDDSLHIEMCTGFYSIRFSAYLEGVEGHGDMEIIDGLWYRDHGFDKYKNFKEYLEQLRPKE